MEGSQPLLENLAAAVDSDDNFYEEIEAPKFVDLTVLDRYRPDDRYWFCMRVGCDQKHEEELDAEKISKNFVLRVMAARSPNVRLQKALNRKCPSSKMKCLLTAPAKSSKPRLSRPPVVSSISRKLRPLPKQSVVPPKSLTTPRNKKWLSNPDRFHSVRNPNAMSIGAPKNTVVAKALVFKSPEKVVRTKISQDLKTPLMKICKGIKQVEITGQQKRALQHSGKNLTRDIRRDYDKPWALNAAARRLSSRKVKSQANASSQNCKEKKEAKSSFHPHKSMYKDNDLKGCRHSPSYETVGNDSSDMELDDKSSNSSRHREENGEFPRFAQAGNSDSMNYSQGERPLMIESSGALEADVNSKSNSQEKTLEDDDVDVPKCHAFYAEQDESNEGSEHREKMKLLGDIISDDSLHDSQTSKGDNHDTKTLEHDNKGNDSVSNNKENDAEVVENADKENASASDNNRVLNLTFDDTRRKVLSSNETCTQKATQVQNKTFKESAHGMKYKRLKPTNPKPFRLRTDERRILKEAYLERRLQIISQKETKTVSGFLSRSKKESEDLYKNQLQQNRIGRTNTFKGATQEKTSTPTSQTKVIKTFEKPSLMKLSPEYSKSSGSSKKSENNLRKTKYLQPKEEQIRPNRVTAIRKEKVYDLKPPQLDVIEEVPSKISRSKITRNPSKCGATRTPNDRSSSRGRTSATAPKEQDLHSIHVPKSCTRKLA